MMDSIEIYIDNFIKYIIFLYHKVMTKNMSFFIFYYFFFFYSNILILFFSDYIIIYLNKKTIYFGK